MKESPKAKRTSLASVPDVVLDVQRLVHDRVKVGVREPVGLDTLEEPEEGGRVRDVSGLSIASTASEQAANTSIGVSNNRARIAGGREDTRFMTMWENGPFDRSLVSAVA